MILQDLIRNIVLYNGVIDPYLQSVKEYVLSLLSSTNIKDINTIASIRAYPQNKTIAFLGNSHAGTHTFSSIERLSFEASLGEERSQVSSQLRGSNTLCTMLMNKSVDDSGKTQSFTISSYIACAPNQTGTYAEFTTGSFVEKPNLFFSHETHEKREYLGEFSLPHEEIQFNTFIGRR